MLCPEVWKFEAPASDFKVEKGDINQGSCLTKVHNFYFNHLISVTIPDTLNIPIKLTDILINDCEYYRIFNLSIYEIINNTFINSFVKAGNLTLLSVNTKIDCDNCVSITPNKKLILSLTKESYQSLGLEGSVSHFCTINKYKYRITPSDLISYASSAYGGRASHKAIFIKQNITSNLNSYYDVMVDKGFLIEKECEASYDCLLPNNTIIVLNKIITINC